MLIALVPDQAALVEAAYERALATVPDSPSEAAGVAAGRASATATLTRRQQDGLDSATQPVYVPRPGPGEYQFTPPFDFANLPGWGRMQPFVINLKEHAVDGPQRLSTVQYARDLTYVKAIGAIGSATLYAGIHFQHAVRDGYRQGRSIGRAVAESLQRVR